MFIDDWESDAYHNNQYGSWLIKSLISAKNMEHGPSAISKWWCSTRSLSFAGFDMHAQNMHKNGESMFRLLQTTHYLFGAWRPQYESICN